jgi:hypothetical protein
MMMELSESRSVLEQIIGRTVTRFAVPWGSLRHCNPKMIEAAKAAGYERIYSHFGGRNVIAPDGRVGYILQRICSHGTPSYVRACLEGYAGRYTFRSASRGRPRWSGDFHATDARSV